MLLCLSAFAGLMAVAMALYPGGTWLDPKAPGHSFFANFLCDLTQPVSLSGVKNSLGAALAQTGMLFFAGALAGFFGLVPQRFGLESRAAPWVRKLGLGTVLCLIVVPLLPSERFGRFHAALALVAGTIGIAGALCAVVALFGARRRALAAVGASALASATVAAALFAYYLYDGGPMPLLVPAVQKVAALLVSAWLVAVAVGVLLEAKETRHDGDTPSISKPPAGLP